MDRKAFVLLSGGMDSTTCLHKAIVEYRPNALTEEEILTWLELPYEDEVLTDWVEAISVNYGQRHIKEAEYAAETCKKFGITHKILNIQGILDGGSVMLANANIPIPNISYSEIKGVSPTYVPFRNGTLLSLITAYAQKWVNEKPEIEDDCDIPPATDKREAGIYFGAHSEDAQNWAYPDCTPEFIGAMANAIYIGSYRTIRLHTPLQWLMKSEIVELGQKLGVDWGDTWSCYAGEKLHCGTCPTCRARKDSFKAAGVPDPTIYVA